ncbi:hypothetical protein [Microbacterium sp. NPDC091662]|uniref:hypothetical protein n=1 Tax=Microbacterium sp. NPDC091662 TaxID=3364211 RepID=UPI00381FAE21
MSEDRAESVLIGLEERGVTANLDAKGVRRDSSCRTKRDQRWRQPRRTPIQSPRRDLHPVHALNEWCRCDHVAPGDMSGAGDQAPTTLNRGRGCAV